MLLTMCSMGWWAELPDVKISNALPGVNTGFVSVVVARVAFACWGQQHLLMGHLLQVLVGEPL